MDSMLDDLPRTLKALRLATGRTQAQLGEAIGCKPSTMTLIEQGRRNPSLSVLKSWVSECGGDISIAAQDGKSLTLSPELQSLQRNLSALSPEQAAPVVEAALALSYLAALNVQRANRHARFLREEANEARATIAEAEARVFGTAAERRKSPA